VTHDQEEALAVSDRIIVMHNSRIVQDGAPRDLYERPANRFIADFIGNANLLPVTVHPEDGPLARVEFGNIVLRLSHRGLPLGGLQLAVRPQSIHLHAGSPVSNEIAGTIHKAAYLGSHMEYEVTISDVGTDLFVIDSSVHAPLMPGMQVGVSIASTGATLVPAA
jgi:iron(III) transport system ATP-binding protein